jgi:hypothetical protein
MDVGMYGFAVEDAGEAEADAEADEAYNKG